MFGAVFEFDAQHHIGRHRLETFDPYGRSAQGFPPGVKIGFLDVGARDLVAGRGPERFEEIGQHRCDRQRPVGFRGHLPSHLDPAIFLLGQLELRDLVHEKALEPVHQRIIAASHLKPLEEDETRSYVEHRLNVVGWDKDPHITPRVFAVIYLFSEGIPRRINLICNRLLLHAFVEQRHKITVADARVVVEELQEELLSTRNLLHESVFLAVDEEESPTAQHPESTETYDAPPGKAKFDALDVSPTTYGADKSGDKTKQKKYMGPEQRRGHRRNSEDRRKDIRFEMDKEDRRKNQGRRRDDETPDFW